MATMNISLPEPMRDWVESQAETGLYANNSDYVRDLIRRDQQHKTQLYALQQAIDIGFTSGDAGELDIKKIKLLAKQREGLGQ